MVFSKLALQHQDLKDLTQHYILMAKGSNGLNVGLLIGLFVFLLVGLTLLPIIVQQVSSLTSGSNPQITGINAQVLNLVPLFYILVLIIVPGIVAYKIYAS